MFTFQKIGRAFMVAALFSTLSIQALAEERRATDRGQGRGSPDRAVPNAGMGRAVRSAPPPQTAPMRQPQHEMRRPEQRMSNPVMREPMAKPQRESAPIIREPNRQQPMPAFRQPERQPQRNPDFRETPSRVPRNPIVTNPIRTERAPERTRESFRNPNLDSRQPIFTPPTRSIDRTPRNTERAPDRPFDRTRERQPRTPVVTNPGRTPDRDRPVLNRPNRESHLPRSPRRDFRERQVIHDNMRLIERTRFDRRHQRNVIHHYRPYGWGRHNLHAYVHHNRRANFWAAFFLNYRSPVRYAWGWERSAWHRHYGNYYRPYTVYYTPAYWVTDYVMGDILREQYEDGYQDGYSEGFRDGARSERIADAQRDQIRLQVERTSTAFRAETSFKLIDALQDEDYLFVVDTALTVMDQNRDSCELSGGDLLKVYRTANPNASAVSMQVETAKAGSCEAGSIVSISFEDLQEMLNSFNEKVDAGLNEYETVRPNL